MINLKITFFKNNGKKLNNNKIDTFENIDDFMDKWGFGYFKNNYGEKYYEMCKELLIKGDVVRFDEFGIKYDSQFFSEDDTIMSIKIIN